jgi:aminopeptidase N
VKHIEMDWAIDFGQQRLSGHVVLHIDRLDPSSSEALVLDASALEIHRVSDAYGRVLDFKYEANGGAFGGRLSIKVPSISQVKIEYSTTEAGQALQWLRPE